MTIAEDTILRSSTSSINFNNSRFKKVFFIVSWLVFVMKLATEILSKLDPLLMAFFPLYLKWAILM